LTTVQRLILLYTPLFLFNDASPTEFYTLSLHDALPIYIPVQLESHERRVGAGCETAPRNQRNQVSFSAPMATLRTNPSTTSRKRSEEHTSELQSRGHLVCRLLLEKKNLNIDEKNVANSK